ncbi:hypothetical protein MNBD_DELTA01-917 [hydrothermal vent metagenome]|uniref:DUF3800 domain-containing protein n=1 Tax=hydrothermal vent metagenome TaxID=652676 RepID=A0A3B0R002_9ZZZZ
MLYLYLDESGDLGFDFFAKKPSSFFTITILAVKGVENNRALLKAVKKTVRSKLPRKQVELKGTKDSIRAKKYFYEQVSAIPFGIYSISLNKRRVYDDLAKQKDKVYNFVAKNVLDRIPVEDASARVEVIIDKSKSKKEIMEFNKYIISNVRGRIDPQVPLDIYHRRSHENKGLQAVDSFSWGLFRKYERKDREWYDIFKGKVKYDSVYLPEK